MDAWISLGRSRKELWVLLAKQTLIHGPEISKGVSHIHRLPNTALLTILRTPWLSVMATYIPPFKVCHQGLITQLSGWATLLEKLDWFPAPTSWLTTICNFNSSGFETLFRSLQAASMQVVHRYTDKTPIQINKWTNKINNHYIVDKLIHKIL